MVKVIEMTWLFVLWKLIQLGKSKLEYISNNLEAKMSMSENSVETWGTRAEVHTDEWVQEVG